MYAYSCVCAKKMDVLSNSTAALYDVVLQLDKMLEDQGFSMDAMTALGTLALLCVVCILLVTVPHACSWGVASTSGKSKRRGTGVPHATVFDDESDTDTPHPSEKNGMSEDGEREDDQEEATSSKNGKRAV